VYADVPVAASTSVETIASSSPNDIAASSLIPADLPVSDAFAALDLLSSSSFPSQRVYIPPTGLPPVIPTSSNHLASLSASDQALWQAADEEEFSGLDAAGNWEEVDSSAIPAGSRVISTMMHRVIKSPDADGRRRLKSRLVVHGCREPQRQVLDSILDSSTPKALSPTVFPAALRLMAIMHLNARQQSSTPRNIKRVLRHKQLDVIRTFDIKSAFLRADLPREVFISVRRGGRRVLYRLVKAMYGLVDSPALWFSHFSAAALDYGLVQFPYNPCIFANHARTFLLALHVDDAMFCANGVEADNFVAFLRSRFGLDSVQETNMLTKPSPHLGIRWTFEPADHSCQLDQTAAIDLLCSQYLPDDASPVQLPLYSSTEPLRPAEEHNPHPEYAKLVGSLLWLTCATRHDISFAVNQLSKCLHSNDQVHWKAAIQVLRYLRSTRLQGVTLRATDAQGLTAWTDASYAENLENRKSTTGLIITWGSSVIFTKSLTQSYVATSSCEAELNAICEANMWIIFFRRLLSFLGHVQSEPTPILTDSKSAIQLFQKRIPTGRSKHVDVRYFKVLESIDDRTSRLLWVPTQTMVADTLTKALPRPLFCQHSQSMQLAQMPEISSSSNTFLPPTLCSAPKLPR
jgi:hypothetical protein